VKVKDYKKKKKKPTNFPLNVLASVDWYNAFLIGYRNFGFRFCAREVVRVLSALNV
jgi:hypothetical protein